MNEYEALKETLNDAKDNLDGAIRSVEYLTFLKLNAERRVEMLKVLIDRLESFITEDRSK